MNLADYCLPNGTAAAQLQDGLPNSQIEGVAAISLSFSGTGQDQITVTAPTPAGVGVAMVPILQDQSITPYPGYILQIRAPSCNRTTTSRCGRPFCRTSSPPILRSPWRPTRMRCRSRSAPYLQDPTTGNLTLLALQQTNANPLTYTLEFPSNPSSPDDLRGQTVLFQITPVPGQPLGNGVYTLTMTVPTPDPTPYIVTESSWQETAPGDAVLQGGSLYGTIPITDLTQNQFGHAEITNQFATSDPTVQAYHFWAINPGPVVIKTEPVDPGVNTWIQVYQAHYNAFGFVDYLQAFPALAATTIGIPPIATQSCRKSTSIIPLRCNTPPRISPAVSRILTGPAAASITSS